ncbi:MAG: hypothetical protein H7Y17_04845 [Chlorobia bacterium]|nr:hypothetical protein [Fimbriimonadaceae bacterium]
MKQALKITLLLIALVTSIALAADKLTVKQLQKEATKFDAKEVTLVGKVDKFQQKTSKAGNDYFVFKLVDKDDKKSTVNIYGQGKLEKPPKDGDSVELKGTYRVEKKIGNSTYKNELQVKPDQIKILGSAK